MHLDDLSHKQRASQSSTELQINNASAAENAVDRIFSTCTRTKPIDTTNPDKTVWWKVDLGGVYNIHSVQIMFKNYNMQGIIINILMGIDIPHKKIEVEVLILSLNHNGNWAHFSTIPQR